MTPRKAKSWLIEAVSLLPQGAGRLVYCRVKFKLPTPGVVAVKLASPEPLAGEVAKSLVLQLVPAMAGSSGVGYWLEEEQLAPEALVK